MEVKKVRNGNKIILIVLGVLIIGVVITLGYVYLTAGNPKDIYHNILVESEKLLEDSLAKGEQQSYLSDYNSYKITLDNKSFSNDNIVMQLFEIVGNIDMEINTEEDNADIKVNYKDKELTNASITSKGDQKYLVAKDVYNKAIKIDNSSNEDALSINKVKVMYSQFVKVINDNLKDEYFSKKQEKILKKGKYVYTTNFALKIEGKEIITFMTNILNDIKEDSELIKNIANLIDSEKEEVINNVDELIKSLNEMYEKNPDGFKKIEINIYSNMFTKKPEKISLIINNSRYDLLIEKERYELYQQKEKYNELIGYMNVRNNENEILLKLQENKMYFLIKDQGLSKLVTSLKNPSSSLDLQYEIKDSKLVLGCNLKVELFGETIDFSININGEKDNDVKLNKVNINSSINQNDISQEDLNEIISNISTNSKFAAIREDVLELNFLSLLMMFMS